MKGRTESRTSEELLTRAEVAEWLGLPVSTLDRWGYVREGPRYFRVGRHARYRRSEVEEWLETRARSPREISAPSQGLTAP